MNSTKRCFAALTATIAGLVACGSDSARITSAPQAHVVSHDAQIDGPKFSDWTGAEHLGSVVNTGAADWDASVVRDGLSMYFTTGAARGGSGGRDLWVARRANTDAPWGTPENLGGVVNTAAHESSPRLSTDGHRLFFTSNRLTGGITEFDIYVSRRRDKRDDLAWEAPVHLGGGVNSEANEEGQVSLFEDQETGATFLYFASNRAGSDDIYVSELGPDGTFGPAVLVPELSSPANETRPMVRQDGLEVLVSSDRLGTLGMNDVWSAVRADTREPWSAPENVGPVINGPFNDWGGGLSFDGTELYFSAVGRAGNLSQMFDLWVARRSKLTGKDQH
jgi:hypothetical protein